MTLDEYIKRSETEPKLFWKLSDGEHDNLLEEAIERIEELVQELERVKFALAHEQ